jgi:hypothetical protein
MCWEGKASERLREASKEKASVLLPRSQRGCVMKQKWGREEYAGDLPSAKAVWTTGALFVALAAAGVI